MELRRKYQENAERVNIFLCLRNQRRDGIPLNVECISEDVESMNFFLQLKKIKRRDEIPWNLFLNIEYILCSVSV